MKVINTRSSGYTENSAISPSSSRLEYGEIAINYNENDPSIFFKGNNNNIIKIAKKNIDNKEDSSNKVTELTSACTHTQYPSAKTVYDIIGDINSILDEINGEVI